MQIGFGSFSPELSEQIGVSLDDVKLEQRLADAITLCSIHGVLTDSEVYKARKRIVKILKKKGF